MPKPPTAFAPTEVVADPDNDRRHRRRFSREEKLRILAEADRCKGRGEVAALPRKESLYSSHLTMWRQQLRAHGEAGLDAEIPLRTACEVLGMPRATARRHLAPRRHGPRRRRPTSHRRLAQSEEQVVLAVLHSERFQDQAPRQVYAELLDEGTYLASPSTMYRILAAQGESSERRNQREARSHAVPRLQATRHDQVWTWDISKLATYVPGVFLNLYLVLDLFSRYPVAWMVAERENSALSKQLFAEAITRYQLEPGSITVHNERGAPMTASGFVDMLAQLGIERSKSRPRVSHDNPFSESCFKTIKYQPDCPGRFQDIAHARRWLTELFDWYGG
ncbi:MAG: hypothetical protein RLZZ450_1517 [Pseudomonadota bacterium]|jgi:putative transposase